MCAIFEFKLKAHTYSQRISEVENVENKEWEEVEEKEENDQNEDVEQRVADEFEINEEEQDNFCKQKKN